MLDVFLEATDEEAADVFWAVLVGVGYCRRVQHVHERSKALG